MKEKTENPVVAPVDVSRNFRNFGESFGLCLLASLYLGFGAEKVSGKDGSGSSLLFWITFLSALTILSTVLVRIFGDHEKKLISLLRNSEKSVQSCADYLHGRGVIKSAQIAEDHFEKAINGFSKVANESANAETCLSCAESLDALAKDDGLTAHPATKFNDMRLVAMAYLRAALLGSSAAQLKVALHYQDGVGFFKDLREAYAWFNICAAAGNQDAARRRESLALNMPPEYVALAQERSKELLAMVNVRS